MQLFRITYWESAYRVAPGKLILSAHMCLSQIYWCCRVFKIKDSILYYHFSIVDREFGLVSSHQKLQIVLVVVATGNKIFSSNNWWWQNILITKCLFMLCAVMFF